jgi:glutaredoxin 3
MAKIIVYTTSHCPYCHMAKQLLLKKGAVFEEIDVGGGRELRAQMSEKAGGRHTVPQIWIGKMHVGGCDDLYSLERNGKLDVLLSVDTGAAGN